TTGGAMVKPAKVLLGWVVNATFAGDPGVMSKGGLVAPANPLAATVKVYPGPVLLMLRLGKVAMPALALAIVVPWSVPPPALLPMEMVVVFVASVTRFPKASLTPVEIAKVVPAMNDGGSGP